MRSIVFWVLLLLFFNVSFLNASTLGEVELLALDDLHTALANETDKELIPDSVKKSGAWMNDPRLITTMSLFLGSETMFALGVNLSSVENEFLIKHFKKVGGHKLFGRGMMAVGFLGMASSIAFIMVNDLMFPSSANAATLSGYYMSKEGLPDFFKLALEDPSAVKFYMEIDPLFSAFVVDFSNLFVEALNAS